MAPPNDPGLGGRIDDLLGGVSPEAEASRPLAPAPVPKQKQPIQRRSYDDDEDDERAGADSVATFDWLLGVMGLVWTLAMVALVTAAFYFGGIEATFGALWIAIGAPHAVLMLTAYSRMASNGNLGFAIACFLGTCCCGIGELVAIVSSNNHRNAAKWRIEGILSTWTMLFVLPFVLGFCQFGYTVYQLGGIQQFWAMLDRDRGQQVEEAPKEPAGPPVPMPKAQDIPAIMAKAERKFINREELADLLEHIVDEEGAKAAASRYKELQSQFKELGDTERPRNLNDEQRTLFQEYERHEREANSKISREEFRVRGIPGAAEPLGLTPCAAPIPRPEGPKPNERPKPVTAEEKIDRAIEDLADARGFNRHNAAKLLKEMEVDESKREAVAKALGVALTDNSESVKEDVAAALVIWGTEKNIPGLIDALGEGNRGHGGTRRNAMKALARMPDKNGAKAVAKMLQTSEWMSAVDALKEMGSVAELFVLIQIDNDDPKMRFQVCAILDLIGTNKSVEDLTRHANGDRVREVKQAARMALKSIEARGGKPQPPIKSR
ncbi:MAG TPA: hypothetical protein VGJ26_21870 [Pirellulales bacterium]